MTGAAQPGWATQAVSQRGFVTGHPRHRLVDRASSSSGTESRPWRFSRNPLEMAARNSPWFKQ